MKKHLFTILLVLVFFVGLSVLLYPAVSDYWNSKVQSHAIADLEKTISNMAVSYTNLTLPTIYSV